MELRNQEEAQERGPLAHLSPSQMALCKQYDVQVNPSKMSEPSKKQKIRQQNHDVKYYMSGLRVTLHPKPVLAQC